MLGLLAIIMIVFAIPRYDGEPSVPLREQLALLKTPKIAAALGVTFLWIVGYSIPYTYISPYLLQVTAMSENTLSIALFGFGVASLIGSKLGGYSARQMGRETHVNGWHAYSCRCPAAHFLQCQLLGCCFPAAYAVVICCLVIRAYTAIQFADACAKRIEHYAESEHFRAAARYGSWGKRRRTNRRQSLLA